MNHNEKEELANFIALSDKEQEALANPANIEAGGDQNQKSHCKTCNCNAGNVFKRAFKFVLIFSISYWSIMFLTEYIFNSYQGLASKGHGPNWVSGAHGGNHTHHYHHHHNSHGPHHRPIHHGGLGVPTLIINDFKSVGSFNKYHNINTEAISALINSKLPINQSLSLLAGGAASCIPTIPVKGLDSYTFDPQELNKISTMVNGAIGTDVHIVSTTDDKASYEVHVVISDESLAGEVSVSQTKTEDGQIKFVLRGPKWLNQGQCIYATVTLKIPASVTELDSLHTDFIYGNYKIDKQLVRAIKFGEFEVSAALTDIKLPGITAEKTFVNVVTGEINGFYRTSDSVSLRTANGKIIARVNVHGAKRSSIVAEAVSGSVSLGVVGGFDGSFQTRTLNGQVAVDDYSDGSNRLHFDKNHRNLKSGTFGPKENTKVGESLVKANVINGDVAVDFE